MTLESQALAQPFVVPHELEGQWKDWWAVEDYIWQGKSHTDLYLSILERSRWLN